MSDLFDLAVSITRTYQAGFNAGAQMRDAGGGAPAGATASEARQLKHDNTDLARTGAPIPSAKGHRFQRATNADICVEFDGFSVEINFHQEGHHVPATETSPAEGPQLVIDQCRLSCGDFTVIAPFDLLANNVRERVLDEAHEQVKEYGP